MPNKSVISAAITEILDPVCCGGLTLLGFTMGRITGFSDLACYQAFQANRSAFTLHTTPVSVEAATPPG